MIPPLLQTQIQIFSKPDPRQNLAAIVVFVVILALFVVWAVVTMRKSKGSGGYGRGSFRKRAKKLGLSKNHIRLLENFIKQTNFLSPNRALENPAALDSLLRKAMAALDAEEGLSPETKESRKNLIYEIKQTIESNSGNQKIIASTLSLPINTAVSIRTKEGNTYDSFITSNMQNMIGLECPVGGERGAPYPWPKNEELGVVFIRGGTEVYAYKTKVIGYKTVRGVLSVFTEHGKNLRQIQNRKSKRKDISRPAIFYPVEITESGKGKKAVRRAEVNRARRALGSLLDLSAGGCSVLTQKPLPRAALIKIEFETGSGKPVSVYGKTLGISPRPPRSAVMHIRFTRVSRLHMNTIRDYVYDYVSEEEE